MAIEKVRAYLAEHDMADRIMEFEVSSATVELAAQAAGVEPERIRENALVSRGRLRGAHRCRRRCAHRQSKVQSAVSHQGEDAQGRGSRAAHWPCRRRRVPLRCERRMRCVPRCLAPPVRDGLPRLRQREQRHRAHAGRARRACAPCTWVDVCKYRPSATRKTTPCKITPGVFNITVPCERERAATLAIPQHVPRAPVPPGRQWNPRLQAHHLQARCSTAKTPCCAMPPKYDPEPIPKLKIPEYNATATEASSGRV